MRINLVIFLFLFSAAVYAFDGDFKLSEEAQKQADFYNKFLQALSLEKNNNPQEALVLFKELLDQSPIDRDIIHEYCSLAINNKKEEFNFCKTALENLKEKTWQNHTLLGDYYMREGSLTQALCEYEKAVKLNPDNLELAFYYAEILAGKDQQAAVNYLNNLAKIYPQTDSFIILKIADIYLKGKEEEKAVSVLEKSLKTVRNKEGIYLSLIKIYEQKKDTKKLYLNYQAMHKDGIINAEILEKLGNLAVLEKDEDNAKKYFTELLNLDEKNPYATRYFALHEQTHGRYESALKYIKQASDYEDNAALQIKAGYYLSMLSKQDELLNLMEKAHKKFPDNNEVSYYYALALVDGKKYNKAAKVFEGILEKLPENELVLFNYSALLYEQKKYNKMEEVLRKIIKINPNNTQALNFLGYFWIDKGSKKDLEEGYKLISEALKLKPGEIAYRDSLAWYYFKIGNFAEADKILKSFYDVKDEEIYLHKAAVAYALKDFESAVKNYENILKINPKNNEAKKGLKKAKKQAETSL
ncbi:MAG: tetratricopeptide repeat protein [Elusimicrobiaceae bacterium]|nr:tetratricopeptide repeat protein [Elusimicrobiaceae bacterium]